MPTLPMLLIGDFFLYSAGNGYEGFMLTGANTLGCQPHDTLTPINAWGITFTGSPGAFMSPSTLAPATALHTFVRCAATYPDANDAPVSVDMFYRFPSGTLMSWVGYPNYPTVAGAQFKIKNIGTDNEITLTWSSTETQIDGATYAPGFGVAQVRVGATITPLSVSDAATPNGVQSLKEEGGTTHGIELITHNYTATLTLPNSSDNIELRIGDGGNFLKWITPHLQPLASFTASEDDGLVSMDASGTTFIYSAPHPAHPYEFIGKKTENPLTIFDVAQTDATFSEDVGGARDEGQSVTLTLKATSDYGCQSTSPGQTLAVHPAGGFGSVLSPGGALHTAVRVGSDVQTYRFKDSVASRQARGAISGAKNPSLWRHGAIFYCAAHKGNGEYHLWKSADFMRTWEQITVDAIWDSSIYTSRAFTCGLLSGADASVNCKKGTGAVDVDFKVSKDHITWPAAAVTVGTYSGAAKQFHIKQRDGRQGLEIIVTNGIDAAWKSLKGGRNGSWFAL